MAKENKEYDKARNELFEAQNKRRNLEATVEKMKKDVGKLMDDAFSKSDYSTLLGFNALPLVA